MKNIFEKMKIWTRLKRYEIYRYKVQSTKLYFKNNLLPIMKKEKAKKYLNRLRPAKPTKKSVVLKIKAAHLIAKNNYKMLDLQLLMFKIENNKTETKLKIFNKLLTNFISHAFCLLI